MHRSLVVVVAALAAILALPAAASACATDEQSYFDSFPDASCLLDPRVETEIDAEGGLRLKTNGTPVQATWDTDTQFTDPGTLAETGTGTAAVLELRPAQMPLDRQAGTGDATGAVLGPLPATVLDNDDVEDPTVVKAGGKYVMWYTGRAEDGSPPAIFRLESDNPADWPHPAGVQPVLEGTPGAFDAQGVYGADVVYDPANTTAPYKMWYSGIGPVFVSIGYATSTDGINWQAHDPDADGKPDPVLDVGLPGSRDAFAVAHPSVLRDSSLWKMWYEADDSTLKAIGYATSTDGINWKKAGTVIQQNPDDAGGNTEFGVFAPTVWKSGDSFRMLFGGRKEVGNPPVLQTKLIEATSSDGIDWTLGGPAINPHPASFDASNLNAPDILLDPGAGGAAFKLYYAGDRTDQDGDDRSRIGLSQTPDGTGWQGGKFEGNRDFDSIVDVGAAATAFDARAVSGPSVADPGGTNPWAGAYSGNRSFPDRIGRLGIATFNPDAAGAAWQRQPGTLGVGGSILPLAGADSGGQRDPSLLYLQGSGGIDDWWLYYTGVSGTSRSVMLASTDEDTGAGLAPKPADWLKAASGAALIASASHPSAVRTAAAVRVYYTVEDGTPNSIARVSSTTVDDPDGPFGAAEAVSLSGAGGGCDSDGARDPVVALVGTTLHMLYTGITGSTLSMCHASSPSSDGLSFTRHGLVLAPSEVPFAYDESGVDPAGLLESGTTLNAFLTGTDRVSRTRGGLATTALPLVAGSIPNGSAMDQFGGPAAAVRDFQSIERAKTGSQVDLWMSVLQPYSAAGSEYWSQWFPVVGVADDLAEQALELQFGVRGVRWQARLSEPATIPRLDRVTIDHAPLQFAAAGSATTSDIAPPAGFTLQSWTSMTLGTELVRPSGTGNGAGTVTVLDAASGETVVPATAMAIGTEQTVSLAGVQASAHPKLRVKLDLTSEAPNQATPLVRSLRLAYASLEPGATPTTPTPPPPPPLPPPPPPVLLTLTAATPRVVYGRSGNLTGTLTQGAAGLAGRVIAVTQQPVGTTAPKPLATATSDAAGKFTLAVKPTRHTTYAVVLAAVTSPPPVKIQVKHRLSLSVRLSERRATFKGSLAPKHARRTVTIQRKSGTRWVRFARVRTTRRSTFTHSARLRKGRYRFRAITGADKQHLAGRSPVRRATVR